MAHLFNTRGVTHDNQHRNLDHVVDEHDDPHWEPEEDGDRCPFCGRFARLGSGCEHHVATLGSGIRITEECTWLERLSDLHDTVTELIGESGGSRAFERFKKHFVRQSTLAKALIRAADREERLGGRLGGGPRLPVRRFGWETGGWLSSSVNIYHPRLSDSDATEDEAVRLYEAFIEGAASAAIVAQNDAGRA